VDGSGSTVYLATPEGDCTIVDLRSKTVVAKDLDLHTKKINTVALTEGAGGAPLMATSCTDGSVKVGFGRV